MQSLSKNGDFVLAEALSIQNQKTESFQRRGGGMALPEGSLVALSRLPACLKPCKLLSLNVNSLSSNGLSSRRQSLMFPRCAGKKCKSTSQNSKQIIVETSTITVASKNYRGIRELVHSRKGCFFEDEMLSAFDISVSRTNLLNCMILTGLLTFQVSLPALAESDVATGLQTIPYLGDLGDISTVSKPDRPD